MVLTNGNALAGSSGRALDLLGDRNVTGTTLFHPARPAVPARGSGTRGVWGYQVEVPLTSVRGRVQKGSGFCWVWTSTNRLYFRSGAMRA